MTDLVGTTGNDTLTGGDANDYLVGLAGDDTLLGGAGNDFLEGREGDDLIDGGAGVDAVVYTDSASAVTVNLSVAGPQATGGAGTDTLIGIENIYDSGFNDRLTGNDGANLLMGGFGNDTIAGGAGNDSIRGGSGDDVLDGGDGFDQVIYGEARGGVTVSLSIKGPQTTGLAGTDILTGFEGIFGSPYADLLIGDDAANYLYGASGSDTVRGGGGDDTLEGGADADVLEGGDGNDLLRGDNVDEFSGYGGADTLRGGNGDDILEGTYKADLLDGGDGFDWVSYTSPAKVDLSVTGPQPEGDSDTLISIEGVIGSSGKDILKAGAGGSFLRGEGGDDEFWSAAGADTLDGGAGNDTAAYNGLSTDYSWTLNADGSAAVRDLRGAGVDTLRNVEVLRFTDRSIIFGKTGVSVTGGAGSDQLTGGDLDDTLRGGAGDDTLSGGLGNDLLDGGDGFDIVSFADATGPIKAWLSRTDPLNTGAGVDTLVSIEGVIGSAYNDFLSGGSTASLLRGGAGNDTLEGGSGRDTLEGGAGDDLFQTVGSSDTIDGGDGLDTVQYWGFAWAYAWTPTGDGGWIVSEVSGVYPSEVDTLRNVEVLKFADTSIDLTSKGQMLFGSAGSDRLTGGAFNDYINGGDGDDTLIGGGGDDFLFGGVGFDLVSYAGAVGPITADLRLSDQQTTSEGADRFVSIEGLIGSAFNDTLNAAILASLLWGGAGNDTLSGGEGNDTLDGGAGDDLINATYGNDTIDGGDGQDTVQYLGASSSHTWTASGDGWTVKNISSGETDTLRNVEVLKFSDKSVSLSAPPTTNVIRGTDDIDGLQGTAGADIIRAGAGSDIIYAGPGNDVYDGGDGNDTVYFNTTLNGVRADLAITSAQDTGVGFDTFIAIESLSGTLGNDVFFGDAGANNLNGGAAGDDTLDGRAGNDALTGGRGNDTLHGGDGADSLAGGSGRNFVYGDAGDDYIWFGGESTASPVESDYVDGGDGVDTLQISGIYQGVSINLGLTGSQQVAPGVTLTIKNVENLIGGDYNDILTGDAGNNFLAGYGGHDLIDGGAGIDTVMFRGASSEFGMAWRTDGWVIWDKRQLTSLPKDADDVVKNVEFVKYSDKTVALPDYIAFPAGHILRSTTTGAASTISDLTARWAANTIDGAQVLKELIVAAGATTSVATLSYQFFTGKVPVIGGVDYLVSPTGGNANNLNSAYYQSFNLENRYINFAVNLGKNGEGNAKFTAEYGSLSLFDATKKAYAAIFGGTPTDAKVTALLAGGRDAYFATYGGDGAGGIGTKAAMVGWLLAEAQKADLGVMVRSNDAWLADLADGSAPFAINILDPAQGYYRADFVFGA